MKPMRDAKRYLPLLLTAYLAACAMERSERVSSAVQPTLFEYGREVQTQGAYEFENLGPACPRDELVPGCSALRTFTKDYKTKRDEIRAIKKLPARPVLDNASRA